MSPVAGYTPLHMAVGYSRVATVRTLLEAGANPEIPDTQGRNVIQLVDSIREQMPLNPQLAEKRIALEEVSALLTGARPRQGTGSSASHPESPQTLLGISGLPARNGPPAPPSERARLCVDGWH